MDEWIRITEAARRCAVARRTVERWIRAGTVRARKVGKIRQVLVDDLPVKEIGPRRQRVPKEAPAKARAEWNRRALADL